MKLFLLFFFVLVPLVCSHGIMVRPEQRGALDKENDMHRGRFAGAPSDVYAHFPAGDKSMSPGAGLRSLIRAAQPEGWVPFEPLKEGFKWRVGVCGDELGKKQDHMRGGKYYYDAKIVETYEQGQNIEITMNIIAHHNGFIEMHLCNVDKCGGEISVKCFREGHCVQLKRAPNSDCDSGKDKKCAPIDPRYPGRWHLPCSTTPENTQQTMGGKKMLYKLPETMTCEHCVLHWFWSTANVCNPPGVVEFFEGKHGPRNWNDCPGQAGAKGGYTSVQKKCAPKRFPEEYYQCSDVRIVRSQRSHANVTNVSNSQSSWPSVTPKLERPTTTPTPTSKPTSSKTPTPSPTKSAVLSKHKVFERIFMYFVLVADGEIIESLPNGSAVDISGYKDIAIEVVTSREVKGTVTFFINGQKSHTEYTRPYFLFGNRKRVPNYWKNPIVNMPFQLRAEAEGQVLAARIEFYQGVIEYSNVVQSSS